MPANPLLPSLDSPALFQQPAVGLIPGIPRLGGAGSRLPGGIRAPCRAQLHAGQEQQELRGSADGAERPSYHYRNSPPLPYYPE